MWSKVLLALVIFATSICAIILIDAYYKFSRLIDRKISGEVFQNTSQVYAAPLMLYPTQPIRPSAITTYLKKVGYAEVDKGLARLGEFSFSREGLEIRPYRESYLGSDGAIRVEFTSTAIKNIVSLESGKPLPSYELQPRVITNLFDKSREKRRLINYEDIPKVLRDAVLAIEDRRFFEHRGFDPIGLARAGIVALFKGQRVQATSTVTQQLVRNFWLTPERTIRRKLAELYMAVILENRLNKQQILTLYANDVYLGQRGSFSVNGFGEAAQSYFGKDSKNLTLPEAAFLAGIIQSPNRYNPYKHRDRAISRRNVVLQAMLETGSISKEQYTQAAKSPLNVAPQAIDSSDAPYFVDLVKDRMIEKYPEKDLLSQHYAICTTVDMELQKLAYQAVKEGAQAVDEILAKRRQRRLKVKKGEPPPLEVDPKDRVQACLIALDPHSGEIRAFVGGRDYGSSQLNRITTAKRQPGSIFKPFVYASALNTAVDGSPTPLTSSTVVDDSPTVFEFDDQTYEPNNYGEKFFGPVTLRRALTKSLNVATIKIAQMAGLDRIVSLARQAGINEKLIATPALALGAYEVTPLEIAGAYTIFANNGKYVPPVFIRSVRDSKGSVLETAEKRETEVLDPRVAYLVTNLMEGVINRGTAARARGMGLTVPAAGKTGTSHDGWFAGYTSGLLCVVWVGFDDNRELNLEGANSALPIWTEFMKQAVALYPWLASEPFLPPEEGITSVMIDEDTGLLASNDCQNVITENYVTGTEPKQVCSNAAHNWLFHLRAAPAELTSSSDPTLLRDEKPAPLAPPKKTNPIKGFFSKIF
ncbi:MAG: PBP1A family penicillin-binding protein [Acidobacteriota bacterium]